MLDKRRNKRIVVEGLDIRAKTIFATEVELLDISRGGISFNCSRRLNIGSQYSIRLELKDSFIMIKGNVIWAKLVGIKSSPDGASAPIYVAGIKFQDVLTDNAKQIMDLIGENLDGKEERRIYGIRFKNDIHEKAILHYLQTYTVKKLSLSGMLIETDQNFPEEKTFSLELLLQKDKNPILCRSRVASCSEITRNKEKRYNIGVEFVDISKDDKLRLKGFINNANKTSLSRPLTGVPLLY
jgi:Tfp pilus assembly protein PilZ